jgi:hypothetical protein
MSAACTVTTMASVTSSYKHDLIHGDLRPANLMYERSPDAINEYRLIDYASYGGLTKAITLPTPDDAAGHTLIGVAVAEARQSPFYPLERRVGRERENGDTVIVRWSKGYWNVHVGYRDDMFTGESEQLSASAAQQMESVTLSSPPNDSREWKPGDRIRIRDFVFEVARSASGPSGFSLASPVAWLVHNNRIPVPLTPTAFEGKDRVLSVSRTFPIWQWSMATDFFSLGVSLLYSLFYSVGLDSDSGTRETELDEEFEAMIAVMSTVQYAGVILPNVAAVTRLLEAPDKNDGPVIACQPALTCASSIGRPMPRATGCDASRSAGT